MCLTSRLFSELPGWPVIRLVSHLRAPLESPRLVGGVTGREAAEHLKLQLSTDSQQSEKKGLKEKRQPAEFLLQIRKNS